MWFSNHGRFLAAALALSLGGEAHAAFNTVRMVSIAMHYPTPPDNPSRPIPTHFLERAKALGYTHVIGFVNLEAFHVEGNPDWNLGQGTYNWSGPQRLYNTLKTTYAKVHAAGLIFVPEVQVGSKHSGHWKYANSNIRFNAGTEGGGNDYLMTPYAPDGTVSGTSIGIDRSFSEFLRVVKKARTDAGIGGVQDYIHIGHDEIIVQQPSDPCAQIMIGQNSLNGDREYLVSLANPGGSGAPPYSFHRAMQEELYRRMRAVQTELGSTTKTMISADPWDPEHNGRLVFQAWYKNSCGDNSYTTKGVGDFLGMDPVKRDRLKAGVIFIPWQYEEMFYTLPYNTSTTFNHFANRGLNYFWSAAIADDVNPITESRKAQFRELVATASTVPQTRIQGFVAWNWVFSAAGDYQYVSPDGVNNGDGKQFMWNTMEYMAYWSRIRAPVVHTAILPNMM